MSLPDGPEDETHHLLYPPPLRLQGQDNRPKPHIGPDFEAYQKEWAKTVGEGSDAWWAETARKSLSWISDFQTVRAGGFEFGDVQWL